MKAFQFFMDYFGKHLIDKQTDDLEADVMTVLSTTRQRVKQKPVRLVAGMAIIKRSETLTSVDMERKGLKQKKLGFDAINWTNEPMMVIQFNKNKFDLRNLFISYHPKHIVICCNNSNKVIELKTDNED
jgi:hypothetical protein